MFDQLTAAAIRCSGRAELTVLRGSLDSAGWRAPEEVRLDNSAAVPPELLVRGCLG
jgi:hypothetical protein